MDLVSESLQKLEPLPDVGTERIGDAGDEEAKWLEEMTEKAARSKLIFCISILLTMTHLPILL